MEANITRAEKRRTTIKKENLITGAIAWWTKDCQVQTNLNLSRWTCDLGGKQLHGLHIPEWKKLKLQYPTVTARLHAEIDEKITIFFEVKKILKSKIFKVENIF